MSVRDYTDAELADIEESVTETYAEALESMNAAFAESMDGYGEQNRQWQASLKAGDATREQYREWLRDMASRRDVMREQISSLADILCAAAIASGGIVNGRLPDIYAIGHAWSTFEVEQIAGMDTGYTVYGSDTVERLVQEGTIELPQASVNTEKETTWDRQHIASAIAQGISRGESIPKMAKRLQGVCDMSRASAIRMARTCATGAENAGTLDGMKRVRDMGVDIQKKWTATLDNRTRISHLRLDGEVVDLEKKFSNGLDYPGDPSGPASEVYNCRCVLEPYLPEFPMEEVERANSLDNERYEIWRAAREARESGRLEGAAA